MTSLQGVVQIAMVALKVWLKAEWNFSVEESMYYNHRTLYDQIMEDLVRMPNLFTHLPEFLLTVLRHRHASDYHHQGPSRIARLVSYGPEQLLEIVPIVEQGDERHYPHPRKDLFRWFKLVADCGPECALLALEQLKAACRDQREEIRRHGYGAIVKFLAALPDREDIHSLCMDAMKDSSPDVRSLFMNVLGGQRFERNSIAANLAWTLTVEATRDEDEKVRHQAFGAVVRGDQTSEASIEKMIELLLEYMPMCVELHSNYRNNILQQIRQFLRRFPTKLSVFLPYLATCSNEPTDHIHESVVEIIQELSLSLPSPQKRELGEMISRIYSDVKSPMVRRCLVAVLYDIGQKIPDFMTDFPDVFSQCCSDTDDRVSELAEDRKTMTVILPAESVKAINKVFWDQSFGVKKELLRHIQQERMINDETAEVSLEMAVNCLESNNTEVKAQSLSVLSSLTQFRSLSSMVLQRLLDVQDWRNPRDAIQIVFKQPLSVLLKYFWETTDERMVRPIAEKHMLAAVTYQPGRNGNNIVSVVERGKNTRQEVPTELVEKLISLVKHHLHETFGDFLP